jgi:hypothetical protein
LYLRKDQRVLLAAGMAAGLVIVGLAIAIF